MGMTRVNTDIHAIGVWDTVGEDTSRTSITWLLTRGSGSLGIPQTGLLEFLGFMNVNRNYLFHNTSLTNSIKNAFQALGLDEKRAAFSPSVWEKPENVTTVSSRLLERGHQQYVLRFIRNLNKSGFRGCTPISVVDTMTRTCQISH